MRLETKWTVRPAEKCRVWPLLLLHQTPIIFITSDYKRVSQLSRYDKFVLNIFFIYQWLSIKASACLNLTSLGYLFQESSSEVSRVWVLFPIKPEIVGWWCPMACAGQPLPSGGLLDSRQQPCRSVSQVISASLIHWCNVLLSVPMTLAASQFIWQFSLQWNWMAHFRFVSVASS